MIIIEKSQDAKRSKGYWPFILLIILIISSLLIVFLLFNHPDSLSKYAPADVSLYINAKPQAIQKMATNHQDLIYSWSDSLNLTPNQAQQIVNLSKREIALIKRPRQAFQLITYQNQELLSYLNQQQISYQLDEKIIYLPDQPDLNLDSANVLHDLEAYQPKKIDFSLIRAYFSGQEQLFLPAVVKEQAESQPFFAYAKYKNNNFIIKTTLQSELGTKQLSQNTILQLPLKSKIYAQNIDFSQLSTAPSLAPENFKYMILQKIGPVTQFIDLGDQYIIVIDANSKSINQLKDIIKYNLAMLLPEEQIKLLPDKTQAKHLVANPDLWDFQPISSNLFELHEEKLNLHLYLQQNNDTLIVSNNINLNDLYSKNNINLTEALNSCQISNSFLYIKPQNNNLANLSKYLNEIVISINEKSNNIIFCID